MSELFSMNGYGSFVWSAYGITFIVFVINIFSVYFEKNKIKKILRKKMAIENIK